MNENNESFYPSDMFEFIHNPEYGCRDLKGLIVFIWLSCEKYDTWCHHGHRHGIFWLWISKKPLSLQGHLKVWESFHNAHFHCDYLKRFWRYKNVLSLWKYNFFLSSFLEKKLCCPKQKNKDCREVIRKPNNSKKLLLFSFY
jgi:hypothetical protein